MRFPVPGPTSRTLSVGFRFAYSYRKVSEHAAYGTRPSEHPRKLKDTDCIDNSVVLLASLKKRTLSADILLCGLDILQNMLAESSGVEKGVRIARPRCLAVLLLGCGLMCS